MANVRKEDLTAEELASLEEVGKGVSQKNIPDEHKRRLLDLRLIKEGVGGLMLTRHGIFIARSEPPSLAGMPREKRSWRTAD
jgi:hypothetical protein